MRQKSIALPNFSLESTTIESNKLESKKSSKTSDKNCIDSTHLQNLDSTKSYETSQIQNENDIIAKLKNGENISHLLQNASTNELKNIAQILRNRILEVVSKNGGHLSSTLGAVELIMGMHAVFDCKSCPFIYDVSHQSYAHKLLTGRFKEFESLRQFGGLSGFIAPSESEFDYFIAGHSSTSLSLGVGVSKAKMLQNVTSKPVIMIGDGAMSAGLVYEALNEIGERKLPMVIILNDNEMSIAKPIGAISKILSKSIATPFYQSMKKKIKKIVDRMPDGAAFIAKRFEESFKLITPGLLFEEFGLDYIGPIDGNNIEEVIKTLKSVQNLHIPVIIHAQTIKGKGYEIAEGKYEKWHGVAPFDLKSGKALSVASITSPTATFSNTLLDMAKKDSKIIGVTAAMPSGTGLDKLMDNFPNRFFDVAIAEQHAVTSMAGMAREGFKPYIAIYSTFLQRAFDQVVHDICIMRMPVVFCIDRAGLVGEDGETHQGLLDISYLKAVPNICLIAPRDNAMLESMLRFSTCCAEGMLQNETDLLEDSTKDSKCVKMESNLDSKDSMLHFETFMESKNITLPLAIRYPRGKFLCDLFYHNFENYPKDSLESKLLHLVKNAPKNCQSPQMLLDSNFWDEFIESKVDSKKILLLGYGNGVGRALFTLLELYNSYKIKADLLDLVCLKPLDSNALLPYFSHYDFIFIFSDSYKINGVGESILSLANTLFLESKLQKLPKIITFEIEDKFITHGKSEIVEKALGLDSKTLVNRIIKFLKLD